MHIKAISTVMIVIFLSSCVSLSSYGYKESNELWYPAKDEVTGKFGYISSSGEWKIPPEYDDVGAKTNYSGHDMTLLPIWKDRKVGYVDSDNNMIIEPQYASGTYFYDGLSKVTWGDDAELNYIDESNNLLVTANAKIKGDFSENLVLATDESGLYGYISTNGEWVIEPKFRIEVLYNQYYMFKDSYATMIHQGKFGYIDRTGKWKIEPLYDDAKSFANNYAAVKIDGKWGYINKDGSLALSAIYDNIQSFSNGFGAVCYECKWFIVNSNMEIICDGYDQVKPFSDGLAAVRNNRKWGFIDTEGNIAIDFSTEYSDDTGRFSFDDTMLIFNDGLAIACSNLKNADGYAGNYYGYINKSGEWEIAPIYTFPRPFIGNLAFV
ncbi:WG repeat-containing protein, partial [Ruminococcaceae bacterium OttesenSCG-928-L11]|nr:WG repeat-containing protein [Ruminococcaceae bacterium OttesenSCG-928-L11]